MNYSAVTLGTRVRVAHQKWFVLITLSFLKSVISSRFSLFNSLSISFILRAYSAVSLRQRNTPSSLRIATAKYNLNDGDDFCRDRRQSEGAGRRRDKGCRWSPGPRLLRRQQ